MQRLALESEADIIGLGGSAGGGKSDVLLGIALTQHQRAIIFRREYTQLKGLVDRSREIVGPLGKYNSSEKRWTIGDRILEFGACSTPGSETAFQGRAHDFRGFDEATNITRKQFDYLCGWLRSPDPNQRCRIVMSFNPPTGEEDDPEWVPNYFAAWLDPQHPNPAIPGELRWYASLGGKDEEVEDGTPFEWEGEMVYPRSRTFIPGRVTDNPYYAPSSGSNYIAVLQSLPEPLRSKLLYGDFNAGREDNVWQIIPTAWVQAAQARWEPDGAPCSMTAVGVDPSRGGKDQFCIATRYGPWFDELTAIEGVDVPSGAVGAQYVISAWDEPAEIGVDVIGVGASTYDALEQLGYDCTPLNSADASHSTDRKTGKIGFINKRAEWWWSLREALDPESGDNLALPPDKELLADLCAPRWAFSTWKIKVESKDDIKKRLGRSPGKGDALVYAHACGGSDWVLQLLS